STLDDQESTDGKMRSEQRHAWTRVSVLILQLTIISFALTGVCDAQEKKGKRSVNQQPFGKTNEGTAVDLFTLTNASGAEAKIMTYGGIVISLKVPDRSGKFDDVVLGYDNLDGYLKNNGPYMGAIIGRYANRIAKG